MVVVMIILIIAIILIAAIKEPSGDAFNVTFVCSSTDFKDYLYPAVEKHCAELGKTPLLLKYYRIMKSVEIKDKETQYTVFVKVSYED